MVYFKKALAGVTALALTFSIHSANFYFYNKGDMDTASAATHAQTVTKINDRTLDYLFPYVEVEKPIIQDTSTPDDESSGNTDSSDVPANMTYSNAEFAVFKGTYLEETADAGESYFNDVLFCGDSLTYALGLDSRYLKSHDVVAWGGLGVYDYLDYTSNPSYNQSEELKSPMEWISELNPSLMYIMLGTNGIAVWSNEMHIEYYRRMLARITAALPNTEIVLVGIPAWASFKNTETFNGQKVDNFNMMLLELAHEKGLYYLNFGDVTRDETGNFRQDLCGSDGIHWQDSCKKLYLNYIRTHSVKK